MAKKKPADAEIAADAQSADAAATVLIGEADAYDEATVDQPYQERDVIVYVGGKSYAHVADAPDGRWIYSDRHLAK